MIKPMDPLKTAMYFLGWGMLVYGIVELVNALKFYSDKKRVEQAQDQQQLDAFEEIKE
jgi:uncharacterized membrane protein HdeD (DUF308 family)